MMVRSVLRVCALAGAFVVSAAALLALSGCGTALPANVDPDQVDAVDPPAVGACRVLTPRDVEQHPSNATRTVPCSKPHTAETYAVGELPADLDDAAYDSREVARTLYELCTDGFARHLGADESVAMRTILSWAKFQPSEKAWKKGARWYRCDLVGGTEDVAKDRYLDLPTHTRNLLRGTRPPDRWMACARGASIATSTKVPCTRKHDWRAATTIKVGDPGEAYPGDRAIEVKTREYCHSSISAWLNYALDFQFGYTWFHEAEWEAGIRRSVCWARTDT
ncbi:septum formation family protein [Nocardioides jiangxiensis]|uniref:Septum formation family protein n=1 Tax=Nocardioides jiangxiensis TaxID=3064524 RepID=A0ABT9AXB0_9ACTN|nr:septum formation family protein [Nocardioides sp. WY-20]MDO7867170.1 septum formation family protein [Nocardioides sp. WY-20]